jgi:hypothetical protein
MQNLEYGDCHPTCRLVKVAQPHAFRYAERMRNGTD